MSSTRRCVKQFRNRKPKHSLETLTDAHVLTDLLLIVSLVCLSLPRSHTRDWPVIFREKRMPIDLLQPVMPRSIPRRLGDLFEDRVPLESFDCRLQIFPLNWFRRAFAYKPTIITFVECPFEEQALSGRQVDEHLGLGRQTQSDRITSSRTADYFQCQTDELPYLVQQERLPNKGHAEERLTFDCLAMDRYFLDISFGRRVACLYSRREIVKVVRPLVLLHDPLETCHVLVRRLEVLLGVVYPHGGLVAILSLVLCVIQVILCGREVTCALICCPVGRLDRHRRQRVARKDIHVPASQTLHAGVEALRDLEQT
mmetsp:Transcript_18358/g.52359  ORF Transcript_18358/g.52359 Transcript_18358/m.52359 type:complete len:313 (-) Transcript_18358:821-1759(-)